MRYAIGIDIGTSGTKTVLFDEQGKTIASATEEYPLYQPQNGYAEQDPLDWYHAAVTTIQSVLQKSGIKNTDICRHRVNRTNARSGYAGRKRRCHTAVDNLVRPAHGTRSCRNESETGQRNPHADYSKSCTDWLDGS